MLSGSDIKVALSENGDLRSGKLLDSGKLESFNSVISLL